MLFPSTADKQAGRAFSNRPHSVPSAEPLARLSSAAPAAAHGPPGSKAMSNSAASNVIPMRDELDRPISNAQEAQFERLLKECRGIALDRLSGSVRSMLDKVEDVLWNLADHTHDRDLRDLYITAKDKALAQRK